MKFRGNAFFFLLLLFAFLDISGKNRPSFLPEGKFESIRLQAQTEQQLFLVYVYREGDRDCKRMLKKTWSDPVLQQYISSNFLHQQQEVLQMDVAWVKEYHLYDWPTVMIFHPEGRLMGRVEGFATPQTMLTILERHVVRFKQETPTPVLPAKPMLAAASEETPAVEAPLPPAEEVMEPISLAINDLADSHHRMNSRSEEKQSKIVLRQQVEGMEAYGLQELATNRSDEEAVFGLLIGSYTSVKEMKRQVEKIQKFWRGKLWVYCEEIDEVPVYKMALGAYEEQDTAESFAKAIRKFEGIEASLINLQKLK